MLPPLTLVLSRTPEQKAALSRLLGELQDPASPNYHKWLTPEQFGSRFGSSTDTLNRVAEWLRSEGFTVQSPARGRGWIVFNGTVAQVQKAFHTEIHRYEGHAQAHFAPAVPPSVPEEFANLVAGIRGLDDFYLGAISRPQPMTTLSNGTHALAPGDIAAIYGLMDQYTGNGQTIAVVGASDVNLADIRQFRTMFQLTSNDPTEVLVGDDPGTVSEGLLEADSDLEWAGGVAPGATILYVYGKDVIAATQYAIDQNLAPILTFSFGGCEPGISYGDATAVQDLAQQGNAQGITWIAASGDGGAAECDQGSKVATQGLAVSFPASIPEVTAVGGTEFNEQDNDWSPTNSPNLSSAYFYLPEIAWNDSSSTSGLLASGGGASVLFAKPVWQAGPGVPNDGARDLPDVALDASPTHDPYIVISGGKTYGTGGTSLSTPVFAGMLALAEQAISEIGGPASGFGNINPSLYSMAVLNGSLVFHDIVSGNNFVPCTIGTTDCTTGSIGYAAGPGYDLVTGLGSVDGYFATFVRLATTTTLSASATQITEGTPVTLTAVVHDYKGTIPAGTVEFLDNGGGQYINGGNNDFILDGTGKASVTVLLPPGTHAITATYTAGCCALAASTSAALNLVVIAAPPQAPALASPISSATDVSVSVSLTWNSVPFATSYDVYFGTNPSPPFWGNVTSAQCTPGALSPNATYYWKVAARNASGATASAVASFNTAATLYTISTVAGFNAAGFSPDGTPAAQALLSGPTDVAFDQQGNLYVADSANNVIRKISAAGIISTVAGGGTGGDGGPATSAALSNPAGIAIDSEGNLYISEPFTANGISSIRKVSPSGIISTIAGGTAAGFGGDGGPAVNAKLFMPAGLAVDSLGNLFAATNGCIREISAGIISAFAGSCDNNGPSSTTSVGDGGPATNAVLTSPQGVAVDSTGNVYIADSGDCRIRKVTNGIISTVAGPAGEQPGCLVEGGLPYGGIRPQRVTVDGQGNIYFTSGQGEDYGVTVVKLTNGSYTTIAGGGDVNPGDGGPGTSALFGGAAGLTTDAGGRIYFAENFSNPGGPSLSQRIRLLTPSTTYVQVAPSIGAGGVVNGATFAAAPIAPGSIVSLFGSFGFASPALPSTYLRKLEYLRRGARETQPPFSIQTGPPSGYRQRRSRRSPVGADARR